VEDKREKRKREKKERETERENDIFEKLSLHTYALMPPTILHKTSIYLSIY
jgi:hypothetical protein